MVTYLDEKTKERTELTAVELTLDELTIRDASWEHLLGSTSLGGSFGCGEVRAGDLRIANVKSPLKMTDGVLHLSHLTMDVFGAKGGGEATLDLSGGPTPRWRSS